jgi:cytochrome P450
MIFYFLSKNPKVREKACKELDELFGTCILDGAQMIREDPHILNKMTYNHAVMKEVLRVFPPANTVRVGNPSVSITDPSTGDQFPTYDWCVWPDAYVLGRDERYFPEPEKFMPERFLPESPFPAVPPGAWRPFERGPRNCIGSEFGTLEVKVVMALTLRDFDFEPVFKKDAWNVNGEPCYQMLLVSAKPKDNCPGRVKRAQRTSAKA